MRKPLYILTTVFCMLISIYAFSQPGAPAGGEPPCGEPFGPPCPIDGGVSLLIAAGVALGGKKAYDLKKNNQV
jgi:hypothetical protein